MRLLLTLLLTLELFAFDSGTASKIFDKIFHAMITKENISVYTVSKKYKDVVRGAENLYLNDDHRSSDIILVDSFDELPKDIEGMLLFTTSYLVFNEVKESVGAFYWDRGHIKIEFSRVRLRNNDISLPASFDKYIRDDI